MIKTLLWDVDGTLLDFKKSEEVSLVKALNSIGVEKVTSELTDTYSEINLGFWKRLERGEIDKKEVLEGRFRVFFERCGIKFSDVAEFNKRYLENLRDNFFVTENSLELLKELGANFKQYIVTNGTASVQDKKLKVSGIEDLVDGIFISEYLGFEKPDPRFFEAVKKETNYLEEETIIIGDSLTSDMKGGKNANIKTVWYNPEGAENKSDIKPDFVIKSLWEIKNILNEKC